MLNILFYISHSLLGLQPAQSIDQSYEKEKAQIEFHKKELDCLVKSIYFESRGESKLGQKLVGVVIINRSRHKNFPDTMCDVVNYKVGKTCSFSFRCSGRHNKIMDSLAYRKAIKVAQSLLQEATELSWHKKYKNYLFFKVCEVESKSFEGLRLLKQTGSHCYYGY